MSALHSMDSIELYDPNIWTAMDSPGDDPIIPHRATEGGPSVTCQNVGKYIGGLITRHFES